MFLIHAKHFSKSTRSHTPPDGVTLRFQHVADGSSPAGCSTPHRLQHSSRDGCIAIRNLVPIPSFSPDRAHYSANLQITTPNLHVIQYSGKGKLGPQWNSESDGELGSELKLEGNEPHDDRRN